MSVRYRFPIAAIVVVLMGPFFIGDVDAEWFIDPKTGRLEMRSTPPEELERQERQQREAMELACKRKGFSDQYYQECILENVPGAKNLIAIGEALAFCEAQAPCKWVKKKRSGIFGVTTAHECFKKYGAKSGIATASSMVKEACYDLYVDK